VPAARASINQLLQTIEVLACVLSHRPPCSVAPETLEKRVADLPKHNCVRCACGTTASNPDDPSVQNHIGTWVECSGCHVWMHGRCVGLSGTSVPDTVLCAACMRALSLEGVPGVSRATLIVCPSAIQKQWFEEIQRHVQPRLLKVVTYSGQKSSLLSSLQGAPCEHWHTLGLSRVACVITKDGPALYIGITIRIHTYDIYRYISYRVDSGRYFPI
jgi:hypothetical protein